jgi:diacylglycerol kinase (ATP)
MPRIRAKNIFYSFKYAIEGLIYSIETQRNMRIHLFMCILISSIGIFLKISKLELAIILVVSCIVIVAEMFNTAIESVVDLYSKQRHPLAKIAKDLSAGAVLISAIFSAIIGIIILWNPLLNFISNL